MFVACHIDSNKKQSDTKVIASGDKYFLCFNGNINLKEATQSVIFTGGMKNKVIPPCFISRH